MHFQNASQGQYLGEDRPLNGFHKEQSCSAFHQLLEKPSSKQEFQRIKEHYPILASTGCSAAFCQSGRMIHTDEPRVGKDCPLHQIETEAVDFLRQMRRDSLFPSDTEYENRLKEVLKEINDRVQATRLDTKATTTETVNGESLNGLTSDGWTQTRRELEYGIRIAWKHSRKCIMRSQYEDLSLCDLRHVRTSIEMGEALVRSLRKAFNRGKIQPTVFVFPSRQIGKSGPMIWNQQLLAFAGYTNDDGSVLGDPMNASLTKSIIELGWKPPSFRTKWDLLPLVTMAEGEEPFITEISEDDFPLIHIRHPRHELSFEKLGLQWVPAPVLSRLGFDIGGVQYTASPFIGWFMDAEIGVRDLADEARYNALPDVAKALYPNETQKPLEQLPEYERLALLSRAQSELNVAVYHSFLQSSVQISDTLTASSIYCQFDDEHLKKHGFRLPADPYWLAPPQGSLIPLWHRGEAPHYQPKPMICRHREDPVKAWKRRHKTLGGLLRAVDSIRTVSTPTANGSYSFKAKTRILIHYCSSGTLAMKLATAVHGALHKQYCRNREIRKIVKPRPLDSLELSTLSSDDIVIVIASSNGRGNVPLNGQRTTERLRSSHLAKARFVIFGNGDSSYRHTFNGAARHLYDLFIEAGLQRLGEGYVEADNRKESPPWKPLDVWLKSLFQQISNPTIRVDRLHDHRTDQAPSMEELKDLMRSYTRFKIEDRPHARHGLKSVTLSSSDISYSAMDYLMVLAPNAADDVRQVLRLLRERSDNKIEKLDKISYFDFLREFVDLKAPFRDLSWTKKLDKNDFDPDSLLRLPMVDALHSLPSGWHNKDIMEDVLISMPIITPRIFSIASTQSDSRTTGKQSRLELVVQSRRGGRFSEHYLNSATARDRLRARIWPATNLRKLCDEATGPIIAFVTGSGLAPIQSLLRFRAQHVREAHANGDISPFEIQQISLFMGFHGEDMKLIHDGIHEAIELGLLDMLFLMPSNKANVRVQDKVFRPGVREHVEAKIKDGAHVFVCANPAAADDVAINLSAILGCNLRTAIGDKYIEDRFEPA